MKNTLCGCVRMENKVAKSSFTSSFAIPARRAWREGILLSARQNGGLFRHAQGQVATCWADIPTTQRFSQVLLSSSAVCLTRKPFFFQLTTTFHKFIQHPHKKSQSLIQSKNTKKQLSSCQVLDWYICKAAPKNPPLLWSFYLCTSAVFLL